MDEATKEPLDKLAEVAVRFVRCPPQPQVVVDGGDALRLMVTNRDPDRAHTVGRRRRATHAMRPRP